MWCIIHHLCLPCLIWQSNLMEIMALVFISSILLNIRIVKLFQKSSQFIIILQLILPKNWSFCSTFSKVLWTTEYKWLWSFLQVFKALIEMHFLQQRSLSKSFLDGLNEMLCYVKFVLGLKWWKMKAFLEFITLNCLRKYFLFFKNNSRDKSQLLSNYGMV